MSYGVRGVRFTVHGVAQPAGSKRAGITKAGKLFVRDDAKRSRPWKEQVAQAAGEAMVGRPMLTGPLLLYAVFVQVRPKGHFGKRGLRPSAPEYPTTKPDATKLLRGIEDAMSKIVYHDDAAIVGQLVMKVYGDSARCGIVVRELDNHGANTLVNAVALATEYTR